MGRNVIRNQIYQDKIERFKQNQTDDELRKDLNLLKACIDIGLIYLGDVQSIDNIYGLTVLNTQETCTLLTIFVNGELYQTVDFPGGYKGIPYDRVVDYFLWKNRDSELFPEILRIDIYTDSKASNNKLVVDGHLYSFEVNREAVCLA